ncbi:hypothetical protein O181_027635 [Austropuccinia psidii MF-1]|uniref:Uncharacterized protein n=1 Tax=Austropuccinia psidii MF-1 TaxID=1389203 RepID=A0A9Q3CRD9_9BASI|nr:hypothetical protein [Austropuccinia psidii MF-1]
MLCLHQDNINCQICHMSFSIKPKTHINTIRNLCVITPHGARKKPTLTQELAFAPPFIISTSFQFLHSGKDMLPPRPPHVSHHPSLCCRSPPSYDAYAP